MHRVLVVGQSGAGKSTLAQLLAGRLELPYVELDGLFHGPGWVPRPSFAEVVDAATRGTGWVVDGNYSVVRDRLWSRADTLVWLDLPRVTTTRRAVLRTLPRLATRAELWNGNRERVSSVLRATHPIRWTWTTAARHRATYAARLAEPRWQHLNVVRLQTPRQVREWLAAP